MENQENVDIIKHEKIKLHIKYIIAIAIIICLGSIVLSLYSQDAFVAQVSFAATITSIVLSVIAIWMSISGERSTSDIRVKISESTERLSGTTKEIETFNNNYKETMDTQLAELKNVQEQLTQIISSVNNVEKYVSFINEKDTINSITIDNNMMDTSQRIQLFKSIYSWITNNDPNAEWFFCQMLQLIINKHKNNVLYTFNEIYSYLAQINISTNYWTYNLYIYWGIINTLLAASVFDDSDAEKSIFEIVNSKLYPQSPSPAI